jgi:MFS family permease
VSAGVLAQGRLPRSLGWALGSGTILQALNSSIIAVALATIGDDLGGAALTPWLVSGMYLACAVASPTMGRLVDVLGARRMYLVGLAGVLAASVAGPFAPDVGWLVVVRVVLGVAASVHFPAAMTIIREIAAERAASPTAALGAVAICGQSIAAIGPSLGGVVVLLFGWQGIFWVNVPLVLASAAALLWLVPRAQVRARTPEPLAPTPVELAGSTPETPDVVPPTSDEPAAVRGLRSLDLPGQVLFLGAMVTLMTGLLDLAALADGELAPLVWIAVSLPLWAGLVVRERQARAPFLDLRLLSAHPEILVTCLRGVATFVAFYAVFYGMPQWYEVVRDLSPAGAGALMAPVFGAGVVSTALAARLSRRLDHPQLLLVGAGALVVSGVAMATLMREGTPVVVLGLVGVLLGAPNGFNNLGNQNVLQEAAPAGSTGVASGIYRTSQYVGAALAGACVSLLVGGGAAGGGTVGLGVLVAGVGGVLVVAAVRLGRRRRGVA